MISKARSLVWNSLALKHYDNIVFDCDGKWCIYYMKHY
jgi:hypothetical protein